MPRSGVQSVLFSRSRFTEHSARMWLALHRFVSMGKIDTTATYHRFRQYPPKPYEQYRTIPLRNYPGIKLVIRVGYRTAAPAYDSYSESEALR